MYRFRVFILTLFFSLGFCHIYGEEIRSEVVIRANSKEEEFDLITETISKLPWFKKNGYPITLPQHKKFEELYFETENLPIPSSDSPNLPEQHHLPREEYFQKIFFSEIYDINSYAKGVHIFSSGKRNVEKALKKLSVLHRNWGFKLMPSYNVLLSLYGVGGSYDPDKGSIFARVTPDGKLPYDITNPSLIMIHEIVHIGIEENIVNKFNLTHWEKEDLVDSICMNYLKDILPSYYSEYKQQEDIRRNLKPDRNDPGMSAQDIAHFVNEDTIVQDLPKAICDFVTKHPR